MNRIIAGRYELLTEVGRGGMSVVYLARDKTLNKNWAVKIVDKTGVYQGQEVLNVVLDEANMMKHLDHPNLPRIVDIIDDGTYVYIIMDYVEGEDLKTILDKGGIRDQREVVKWGKELASVLSYLHNQDPPIIYRDMKPANIILQPNGSLKLIDFGIARRYKGKNLKDTVALGTRGYAAPEQFAGEDGTAHTDARTDVYNLGVTLYELLTDHVPSEPPYKLLPMKKFNSTVSQGLEKVIIKCTRNDPADRYQTASEVGYALSNYEKLDDEYIAAQKKKIRNAITPMVMGLVFVLLSVGMFVFETQKTAKDYESLIRSTGDNRKTEENLLHAIDIDPERTEAYKLLLEHYSVDGLTEQEVSTVLEKYNANAEKLGKDAYLDVNYAIGEDILVYFTGETDSSVRNKMITSLPFFEAIVDTEETEYENYAIADVYCNLGTFYKEYIVGDKGNFVRSAEKKEYEALFNNFDKALEALDEKNVTDQLVLTTCSLMLNIMENERYNIAEYMPQDKFTDQARKIGKMAETVKETNSNTKKSKEEILAGTEALQEHIKDTYENKSKEEVKANDNAGDNQSGQ